MARPQRLIPFDLLIDPVLLVSLEGRILAANRAAEEQLALPTGVAASLIGLVSDPQPEVQAMLRRGAASGEPLPGVLHMRAPPGIAYRCDAARYTDGGMDRPSVLLQLRPHASAARSFVALTDKIDQLSREIVVRRGIEQRLTGLLYEKETLIQEVHHRVKNNLQVISSLIHLQCKQLEDPAARHSLMDLEGRVGAMGIIHRRLYDTESDRPVSSAQYIQEVCERILYSQAREDLDLRLDIEAMPMDLDTAIPLGLIVYELVSNACKHAFPGGRSGAIEVTLRRRGDDLDLMVADDGCGIGTASIENGSTFGMQLARALARQIGGELRSGPGPGTRLHVTFAGPVGNGRN